MNEYQRSAINAPRRRRRRWLRWALLLVLGVYGVCTLYLLALRWMNPVFTTVQIQRRMESFFQDGEYEARSTFVPLSRIPRDLQHAVIAAEDGRFFGLAG